MASEGGDAQVSLQIYKGAVGGLIRQAHIVENQKKMQPQAMIGLEEEASERLLGFLLQKQLQQQT